MAGQLDYELALAESARKAGNPTYAAFVLERVVARHPRQAGARLDLAILSLQIGDTITAARHLNILQTLPDAPPLVADLLHQLEQRLKPADKAFDNSLKFQGTLGVGYDTNPNLGVLADAIDLIINGSPQTLIPDATLAPSEDVFQGLSAGVDYPYSPKGVLSAALMARNYDTLSDEDSLASSLRLYHNLHGNSFLEAVLGDFRTAEGLYLSRAGVGLRQRFGGCQCSTAGLLVDALRGSEKSSEASRLKMEIATARRYGLARFLLHSNVDYSVQPEAGWGNTLGAQLGANALLRFGRFTGSMEIAYYQGWDEHDYSPLFGSRRRDIGRSSVRAGVSYPVAPGVEAFLDWSYARQESDIVLFDYERQVSALGLRLAF